MAKDIRKYQEFWLHYLKEHSHPLTRKFHFWGINLIIGSIGVGVAFDLWALSGIGIGMAVIVLWAVHKFVEHNHPVFLRSNPFWAVANGLQIYFYYMTGQLEDELKRAGVRVK